MYLHYLVKLGKHENQILCVALLQTYKTHQNYHLVIDRLSFIRKTINCMYASNMTIQGRKHPAIWYANHWICVIHTIGVHCVCHDIRRRVSYGSFFSANIESQRALSVRYFTTLSQATLTAIKHVDDDKFCFQQDNTLAHHVCNTVKLQENKLSTSLLLINFNLTATQWILLIMRFKDSHISTSISCKSTRLKKSSKSHEVAYSIRVKRRDFCFSVSQGNAKTLFRWGRKINYSLIT